MAWDVHKIQRASGFDAVRLFAAQPVTHGCPTAEKWGTASPELQKSSRRNTKVSSSHGMSAWTGRRTHSLWLNLPAFHAQQSKNWGFNQTPQFGHFVRTVSTPEKAKKKISGLLHKAEHKQQPTETSYIFNRLQTITINVTFPLTLRNKCFSFFFFSNVANCL